MRCSADRGQEGGARGLVASVVRSRCSRLRFTFTKYFFGRNTYQVSADTYIVDLFHVWLRKFAQSKHRIHKHIEVS